MNQIEFIKYEATPGEKHMGIATIKMYGKIVLRYKLMPNKDGSNYFLGCASYKITSGGEDSYLSAFVIDSRAEEEEINQVVRSHLKKFMGPQAPKVETAPASSGAEEVPF